MSNGKWRVEWVVVFKDANSVDADFGAHRNLFHGWNRVFRMTVDRGEELAAIDEDIFVLRGFADGGGHLSLD